MTGKNRHPSSGPHASTGLGRGLAGILGEALATAPSAGVNDLLGAEAVRRSPQVREMVTQLALTAVAEGFAADGVVLVRREASGDLATVSSRLPSTWNGFDAISFEVSGRLWAQLSSGAVSAEQHEIGRHHILMCGHRGADGSMAAAVIRAEAFDDHQADTVTTLVRSVGAALEEGTPIPAGHTLRVLSRQSDNGVLADVRLAGQSDRRHAAAVAETAQMAVARAASELCDERVEVTFAGDARVDGNLVTVVVVNRAEGGPLLGLAVTEPSASTGPAEAVFSAARVIGVDPFSPLAAGPPSPY